jgi:HAD superfamily hydrolase (TIGR01509 family)
VNRKLFHARVVLLDWDGTLLNSYAADQRAYLAMFREMGVNWDVSEIDRHYSPDWYQVYRAAKIPRPHWKRADRMWRVAYRSERPALLSGARTTLRNLERRFVLGLVTAGSGGRVRKPLREFGLGRSFSVRVFSEDSSRKKPHPAPLQIALKLLRVKPQECVYVGDSPEDIEMARRAGVRAIGVLGPFPTAGRIRAARPDLLLRSIRDLPRHLRSAD